VAAGTRLRIGDVMNPGKGRLFHGSQHPPWHCQYHVVWAPGQSHLTCSPQAEHMHGETSSFQPAALRRWRRLSLEWGASMRNRLRPIFDSTATFYGPWSLRVRASSSPKMMSRLRCPPPNSAAFRSGHDPFRWFPDAPPPPLVSRNATRRRRSATSFPSGPVCL